MNAPCPECHTDRSVTVLDDQGDRAEVRCKTCQHRFTVRM